MQNLRMVKAKIFAFIGFVISLCCRAYSLINQELSDASVYRL
ncbi:MAG: hypothetical protein RLZZ215_1445 [Pseudomonadota bacterium]|jgi:hypothetical protein